MRIINTETLAPEDDWNRSQNEWIYNGLDCAVTSEIFNVLSKNDDNLSTNTYELSMSLVAPILDMGLRGVKVDLKRRDEVLKLFRERRDKLKANLERLMLEGIGEVYSPTSPTQLLKFFYSVLRLKPVKKRNSKGQYAPTVNRDALEQLQKYKNAEVFCKYILAIRDLNKKIGFLKTEIDEDKRIRCNFNIAGTDTGRLASSMSEYGTGTNLQNVEHNLREVFIADRGKKFCNIDLEQADSRNVGALIYHLFGDSAYLDACESGDLHTTVCRMAWGDLEWGDDPDGWRSVADQLAYRDLSYRDLAKKLGHGTNYYGTPRTMGRHTKVPTALIKAFQHAYYGEKFKDGTIVGGAFPAIHRWHSWVDEQLRHGNTLTTLFGRRRCFFGRVPDDSTLRKAIAYCGQSATADEMNLGLMRLWRTMPECEMLIQVHDSILFQFPEELEDTIVPEAMEALKVTIDIGNDNRPFTVPVEAKIGWNWGDWDKRDPDKNPNGLKTWTPEGDTRKRKKSIWLPRAA